MLRFSTKLPFAAVLALMLCAGCTSHAAAFDLAAIRRHADLAATEVPGSRRIDEGVALREIRFTSTSWDGGVAHPIRIQAFLAIPPGSYSAHSKPAVVFAHGLGGQADPKTAVEICRNIDAVALTLSGPGLGGSEGIGVTPQDLRPLFSGEKDIRQNWLYAYVYAILRAITYLETVREVDAQAIAISGFSLGGLATFIANGVDDRIRGALPVAAAGGLLQAASSDTWLRRMVQSDSGLKPTDPGPMALFRSLDPLLFAGRQHGAVYMLIGAQDEYFPLANAVQTYQALRAPEKRLTVVADYDHGWYFGGGCPARCMPGGPHPPDCPPAPVCPSACPSGAKPPYCGPNQSYNRQADFTARWALLLRSLVARHVARPRRPFEPPPDAPIVERHGDDILVHTFGLVRVVRLSLSSDCGFTYSQIPLSPAQDGVYRFSQRVGKDAIVFAEAEAIDGAVSTSIPSWPAGCVLRVRPFGPLPQSI